MMKWFKTAHSIEEVKRIYRKLCKEYHPDIHGAETEDTMKEINAEYERAFNRYKDIHESTAEQGETYTKETHETAAEFANIINQLIKCDGIEIDLCGRWIWLKGNTFSYKEIIKGLGFRWAAKKKMWYWRKEEDASHNRRTMNFEEIKSKYGCEIFEGASAPKLTAT
ncbi:MAG: DnaJ domain-containing protein [Huintestinicola sp.]